MLHDVPQNGPSADFDHRLGFEVGLLAEVGPESPGQDHGFHGWAGAGVTPKLGRGDFMASRIRRALRPEMPPPRRRLRASARRSSPDRPAG